MDIVYSSWKWEEIRGAIGCYLSSDKFSVSGSGAGWTASGTLITVNATSVSSYYRLDLSPPKGYKFPEFESSYPVVQYSLVESSWVFYSNEQYLLLYNIINDSTSGYFDATLTLSGDGKYTYYPITISFFE